MATQTLSATVLQRGSLFAPKPSANNAPAASFPMARPYKSFLTPAMHRRFARAFGLVLLLCWAEAILMSNAGWFWAWFPISMTGIRTLILSLPCLAVFIVRLENLHIGTQTSTSGLETLVQRFSKRQIKSTALSIVWYTFSAMLFGEIYIWTRGHDAGLSWIDPGRLYERSRVNENPIFLRAFYLLLALVQVTVHMVEDLDRITIEDQSLSSENATGPEVRQDSTSSDIIMRRFSAQRGPAIKHCVNLTLITIVLSLPFYFLAARHVLWQGQYWFASRFMKHLQPNTGPVGLIQFGRLVWQTVSSSLLLVLLWQASNTLFTIFVSTPPLKKGQPLTDEVKDAQGHVLSRSKDPNWSLIRGLGSPKEVPKSFAFWELNIICHAFPERRKTIFMEVDRNDRPRDLGTTWSQVSKLCLAQISAISERVKVAQQPIESKQEAAEKERARKQQEHLIAAEREEKLGLPRIADHRVIDDRPVVQKSSSHDFMHAVGEAARSVGQSPGGLNPVIPYARKAITYGADRALGKEIQTHLRPEEIKKDVNGYVITFLQSPLGAPFRQTFARRACAVVLGVPHSNKVNIINATRALVKLVVESLKEDDYGQVAKDIPTIVRTLTSSITDITKLIRALQPHWTDVEFRGSRRVKDVEDVWIVLRDGLEEVLLAFDEYASVIGLTKKEIREAKEAVGREKPKMAERR